MYSATNISGRPSIVISASQVKPRKSLAVLESKVGYRDD
jgi:hypothetical protein